MCFTSNNYKLVNKLNKVKFILQCFTFIQVPNDCLLLEEVITELPAEPKRQHVMSECPENTHSINLISVQMEIIANTIDAV